MIAAKKETIGTAGTAEASKDGKYPRTNLA